MKLEVKFRNSRCWMSINWPTRPSCIVSILPSVKQIYDTNGAWWVTKFADSFHLTLKRFKYVYFSPILPYYLHIPKGNELLTIWQDVFVLENLGVFILSQLSHHPVGFLQQEVDQQSERFLQINKNKTLQRSTPKRQSKH